MTKLSAVGDVATGGVQFGKVLVDRKGEEVTESPVLTAEQLEQLMVENDPHSIRRAIRTISERSKVKMTLARACEVILDTPIKADEGEGTRPKLKRAALIDKIYEAAGDMRPLQLPAEDIALIKQRAGEVFTAASMVHMVCVLLDPASD